MKKAYGIWLLIALGIFITAMVLTTGGFVAIFLDIPSFIIVAGTVFLVLLSAYSPKEMGNAFRNAMEATPFDKTECEKGLAFFGLMGKALIVSGIIGTLIGLVSILGVIGLNELFGEATAVSILTVLYSLLIYLLIVLPYSTGLKKKLAGK